MQSFLAIEWRDEVPCLKSLPETFIIGPFIEALNDPVQHKDFGQFIIYLCPLGYLPGLSQLEPLMLRQRILLPLLNNLLKTLSKVRNWMDNNFVVDENEDS